MHAPTLSWIALLLGLLILAGGALCAIVFRSLRVWALFGLGVAAVLLMLIVSWTSVRETHVVHGVYFDHEAMMPQPTSGVETRVWPHPSGPHHPSEVDVDALLGPRIQLGRERTIEGRSAYPSRPAKPLELNTPEAAPPEPEAEHNAPEENSHEIAPSDSAEPSAGESNRSSPPANNEPPDWVESPPPRDPENYPVVIVTDPFASKHEADRQVTLLMMVATTEVINDLVGVYQPDYRNGWDHDHPHVVEGALRRLRDLGLTPGQLRSAVWQDEYVEHLDLELPSGGMLRVHTLLEFDEEFQTELQNRWREHEARKRLGLFGMIAAGIVGFLAVVWGTLRFDTATKGFYTKWLVGGAVLATFALGVLVLAAIA